MTSVLELFRRKDEYRPEPREQDGEGKKAEQSGQSTSTLGTAEIIDGNVNSKATLTTTASDEPLFDVGAPTEPSVSADRRIRNSDDASVGSHRNSFLRRLGRPQQHEQQQEQQTTATATGRDPFLATTAIRRNGPRWRIGRQHQQQEQLQETGDVPFLEGSPPSESLTTADGRRQNTNETSHVVSASNVRRNVPRWRIGRQQQQQEQEQEQEHLQEMGDEPFLPGVPPWESSTAADDITLNSNDISSAGSVSGVRRNIPRWRIGQQHQQQERLRGMGDDSLLAGLPPLEPSTAADDGTLNSNDISSVGSASSNVRRNVPRWRIGRQHQQQQERLREMGDDSSLAGVPPLEASTSADVSINDMSSAGSVSGVWRNGSRWRMGRQQQTKKHEQHPDTDSTDRYVMEFPPDWEGEDGDATTETNSIRSNTRLQAVMRSFRTPRKKSLPGNMIVNFEERSTTSAANSALSATSFLRSSRNLIFPKLQRDKEQPLEALDHSIGFSHTQYQHDDDLPATAPGDDNRYFHSNGVRASQTLETLQDGTSVNSILQNLNFSSTLGDAILPQDPDDLTAPDYSKSGVFMAKNEAMESINSDSSEDEELLARISFMSNTFDRNNQESNSSILPLPIGNGRNNYDQGGDSSASQSSIALNALGSLLANRSDSAAGPAHSLLLEGGRSELTPWESNHNMLSRHQHLPTVSEMCTPSLLPALPPKIWAEDTTLSKISNEHQLHDNNLLLGNHHLPPFDDSLESASSPGEDIYDRSMETPGPSSSTCASDSFSYRSSSYQYQYKPPPGGDGGVGSALSVDQQSHSALSQAWMEYQNRNQLYDHDETDEDDDDNTSYNSRMDPVPTTPNTRDPTAYGMSEIIVSDAMSCVSGLTAKTGSTFGMPFGHGAIGISNPDQQQQLQSSSEQHASLPDFPQNVLSVSSKKTVTDSSISGEELLQIKHQNQRKAKELLLRSIIHRLQDNPSLLHNVVSLSEVDEATEKNEVTPSTTEELKREGLIVGYSRLDHVKLLTNLDSILKELSKHEDDGDVLNSIRFLSTVVRTAVDKSSLSPRGNYDVEGCTRHTKWEPKSWLNAAISAVPANPHYRQFDSPGRVGPSPVFTSPSSHATPNASNLSVWKDDDQQQLGRSNNKMKRIRMIFEVIITLLPRMTSATRQLIQTEHPNPDAIMAMEGIKKAYMQLMDLNVSDMRDLCDGFEEDGQFHQEMSRERADFRGYTDVLRKVIEEVSVTDSCVSKGLSPVASAPQLSIEQDGELEEEVEKERACRFSSQDGERVGSILPSSHDIGMCLDDENAAVAEDVEHFDTTAHVIKKDMQIHRGRYQWDNYSCVSGRTMTSDLTMISELTMDSTLKDDSIMQREPFQSNPSSDAITPREGNSSYAILKLAGKMSSDISSSKAVSKEHNKHAFHRRSSLPTIEDEPSTAPSKESNSSCESSIKSLTRKNLKGKKV